MALEFAEKHPRRTFGGKLYRADSWSKSKTELQKLAKKVRQRGQLARVVKKGEVWALYIR